ncbi:MAG: hypothetical protein JWL77_3512 [Chthonomonadaceae bacterium]|nr:hypothetical protein [Chthonomonadaceae bacterium]
MNEPPRSCTAPHQTANTAAAAESRRHAFIPLRGSKKQVAQAAVSNLKSGF